MDHQWDGYDQHGEKIGIGEPLFSNSFAVTLKVKSECRCCGKKHDQDDAYFEFETHIPFEEIKEWLESGELWRRGPGWFLDDLKSFTDERAADDTPRKKR